MEDSATRARDLLAARREHSTGQGNFPIPEPHFGLRDERPEDREPSDLPKDRDDRSAPKGDVPAGQADRNPGLETRVPPPGATRANPPGGMELARRETSDNAASRGDRRPRRDPPRPNARRSSAAKREATRGERPRSQGRREPGQAAKDTEKNAKRRAGEARTAKRPTPVVRRRTPAPVRRPSGLAAAPRRTAKTAPPERGAGNRRAAGRTMGGRGGRSGNVQRTAARARGSLKPLTKRAAKGAGPDTTQGTAQGGKKASGRTSAGRGRAGRRS